VYHIGKEVTFAGAETIMAATLNLSTNAVQIFANQSNTWTNITGSSLGTQLGSEDVYPTSCGFKGQWFFAPGGPTSGLISWDGVSSTAALVTNSGPTPSLNSPPLNAKIVMCEASGAHLFLLNVTDSISMAAEPTGIYWSGFLDQTSWNGGTNGNGSGSQYLADDNEPITAGCNYGPFVIVFKLRSMYIAQFDDTASTGTYFDFVCRETDRGCAAQGTIQPYNNQLIWLGNDAVFLFDGNTVQAVTDKVISRFISQMNPAYVQRSFGAIDRYNKRYNLWLPLSTTSSPPQMLKLFMFDFQTGAWTEGSVSPNLFPVSSYVYSQTWAEQTLIGDRGGVVYQFNPEATTDGASTNTFVPYWESHIMDAVTLLQGAAEVGIVESVQVHGAGGQVSVSLAVTDVYEDIESSFEQIGIIILGQNRELSLGARGEGRFIKLRLEWTNMANPMQVQGFTLRLRPLDGRSDR
jgi:hypothetical protein